MKYFQNIIALNILLSSFITIFAQTFELRPQIGHSKEIIDFTISSDSKFLLTTSKDLSLKIWDLETGRLIKTFYDYKSEPIAAVFSNDNLYFYSYSSDGVLLKYDIATLNVLSSQSYNIADFVSLKASKKGSIYIIYKNWDDEIIIENVDNTNEKYQIKSSAQSFDISPDFQYYALIDRNGKLAVGKIDDYNINFVPSFSNLNEHRVSFSELGDKFLLWKDKKLAILDSRKNNELGTIQITESQINKAEFVSEDKFTVVLLNNGDILSYKYPSLNIARRFSSKNQKFLSFKVSANQKYLIASTPQYTLEQYDFLGGQYYLTYQGFFEKFKKIKISKEKKHIGILTENYSAVWEFKRGRNISFIPFPEKTIFNDFSLSEKGDLFVAACSDYSIKVFQTDDSKPLKNLHFHTSEVTKISVSPLGRLGISSEKSGIVKLFDVINPVQLNTFTPHSDEITGLSFGNNGLVIFSCSKDGSYKIYDNLKANVLFDNKVSSGISQAYIPNSLPIGLILTEDNTIYAINLINGTIIKTYSNFENKITALALSEKGLLLAVADSKFFLKILDFNSGAILKNIKAHEASINSIEFYDDENVILTASDDGLLKFWDYIKGEYLVSLALMSDGKNFAIVATDRRFEASSEAASRLHFVSGFRTLSLESNRTQYFTPNLMKKILR